MKIVIREVWKKFEFFIEGKSLAAAIVVGVSKFFGLIILSILCITLIIWTSNLYKRWEEKNKSEEIFFNLVKANGYDTKIVGLKEFHLSWMANLVDDDTATSTIPDVPKSAIFFDNGRKRVFLEKAMPQFFTDVEFSAHNIRCVQGRVRKQFSDLSFGRPEDKFFVFYRNSIHKESEQAFNKRIEEISDEKEKMKKNLMRSTANEWVDSHSALYNGNCLATFQGWIEKEAD
jgi:hypothetical protein